MASAKSKEDEAYKEEALNDTFMLQKGDKGRTALWKHIMNVSIPDLKKNYEKLNVSFELHNSAIAALEINLSEGGINILSKILYP